MDRLIDYVKPAPQHSAKRIALVVAILGASFWLAFLARLESRNTIAVGKQYEVLRTESMPKALPKLSKTQTEDLNRWAALKAERSFSWEPVLVAVERAGNSNIELLAFQPDKAAHMLTLRGEGKDELAIVEFIERLGRQRILRDVHLARQKKMQRAAMTSISFEIKAMIAI